MATLTIRGLGLLSALLITLGGCTSSGKSPEQPELSLVPTATTPDDQRTDRSKPGAAALVTVGPTQTVFDWSKDRCDNEDIPDLPARAFRDANGDVQLLATHYINRRFVGPSLDAIRRSCQVVMRSKMNADPSRYADHEWLASPYTTDGQTVYALIHDEYHGHEHTGRCPQGEYYPCWYNSVTLAVSTDGGASYRRVGDPPGNLVATVPQRYEAGAGPYGVFEPSNIVTGRDGLLYSFVRVDEHRSESQRICLMRTANIADPRSWRAWDGRDFSIAFVSPYVATATSGAGCASVDPDDLGVTASSVTFNTYLDLFVMVGVTAVHVNGREVWGVVYSFSDDLVDWTPRTLLFEAELPWTYQPGDGNVYLYPSLIDPASTSRTFDSSGRRAYLYLTRFNTSGGGMTLDRDLVRLPVEFFASPDEANSATVPFRP